MLLGGWAMLGAARFESLSMVVPESEVFQGKPRPPGLRVPLLSRSRHPGGGKLRLAPSG